MMYRFVFQKSVTVPGVRTGRHISHVTSDQVWISDYENLILTNTTGDNLDHVTDIGSEWGGHTVNSDCDLFYIDRKNNINKLSKESKDKSTIIKFNKSPWVPRCVYCSRSTGDLLVAMSHTDTLTGKVVRYNSTGEIIQTIEHNNNTGRGLYSLPLYITENGIGNVIVSDWDRDAVVVTDRDGNYRFSYTGPSSGSVLRPRGICTDALSHILLCDWNTQSVQMLNCDGHYMTGIQTQGHGIDRPYGLSYDSDTQLLWVGSGYNNTVYIYRVVDTDSLTDPQNISISRLLSPSTLAWPRPAHTRERHLVESTYPLTPPTAQATATSTLERPRPRCIQGIHPLETYPWIPPSGITYDSSIQEQLTPPNTQERLQLMWSQHSSIQSATVTSTKHPLKRELDELPSGSSQTAPVSESPPPKKLHRTERGIKLQIKEYKGYVNLHGNPTPLKRSTSMNQIDVLKSENFREELRSVLHRIEYMDCNDICGSSVKHYSIGKIETCNKFSTQGIFGWTKSCIEKIREARKQKCKCFISTYYVQITIEVRHILAILKKKHFFVRHFVHFAIESRNYILLSELVRSYAFQCDFHLETIFMKTSKNTNAVIVETILKSAKCMILRKRPSLLQNSIQLSLCHDCENGNRVTIVLSFKGTIEMTDITQEMVMGKKMFLYNCSNPSDEAYNVFKSYATSHSKETLPTISEKEARELFKRHSNLTMISASPYKSIGYSKGKHRVVKKPCILLLCLHKGYIPYGEEEFPRRIGDVEVDVQEGFCNFGNGESIEMGGDIRRKGSKSVGTIGGFVSLPFSKIGLITCAHVVLSHEELEKRETDNHPEVEAFINSAHSYKVCGKVIDKAFPNLNPLEGSSVDAALIEINSSSNVAGFCMVSEEQLRSAGFQTDKPPKFQGNMVPLLDLPNLVSGSVVKYGVTTGFTLGCLFNECMHVRIQSENLTLPDFLGSSHPRNITVYNQMEIEGIRGKFFDLGDSGSFVFCINQDETLSCIGMAIALTSRGTCLVTPIENVLKSLKLPVSNNCIIPVEVRLSSSAKPSTDTMTILNAISQMKSDFDKQQKDSEKRLIDIEKGLAEQRKDIEYIKEKLPKSNPSQNQPGT
ncbi:uncharacterized protein LOC134270277 [Saccostrea cucullata]|uniref:uncharacterized protein LOC134270277 n=1 Tax=Saccostrea cuccullata TaxID=36930 RepID=UPI002ED384B7